MIPDGDLSSQAHWALTALSSFVGLAAQLRPFAPVLSVGFLLTVVSSTREVFSSLRLTVISWSHSPAVHREAVRVLRNDPRPGMTLCRPLSWFKSLFISPLSLTSGCVKSISFLFS